jgi:AcrR family transcriptional regulator
MGSKERRDREREDTRRRILEAARTMFVRNGYEATTMRAIAKEVEYTPTAIYHHFKNKDALLTELCTIDFRSLAAAFLRIGQVADPVERIKKIGAAYVEFAQSHAMQYQLMFMTRRPDGVTVDSSVMKGDPSQDAYAFLRQACAEAISTGRIRSDVNDPDLMAQMVWSAQHGLISLQIVKEHELDWRDLSLSARHLGDTMMRGLLKNPQ